MKFAYQSKGVKTPQLTIGDPHIYHIQREIKGWEENDLELHIQKWA